MAMNQKPVFTNLEKHLLGVMDQLGGIMELEHLKERLAADMVEAMNRLSKLGTCKLVQRSDGPIVVIGPRKKS